MHDFMAPLGLGQLRPRSTSVARSAACPVHRVEEGRLQAQGAAEVVRRETISLGIGQGYNAFTMLQMAQATAAVATGGQRAPRLVREIETSRPASSAASRARARAAGMESQHVAFIHQARCMA